MKTVILAGGRGTRLAEETHADPEADGRASAERPILWHIMQHYAAYGYADFVVALGYKGYVIKEYFANQLMHACDMSVDLPTGSVEYLSRSKVDWKVTLIDTGADSMTGGRVKRLSGLLDERFLLTYGDGLSDVPIDAVVAHHEAVGALATVTAVHPPPRFGSLGLADGLVDGLPREAARLPRLDQRRLLRRRARGARPDRGRRVSFEAAPLTALARAGSARRLPARGLLDADGHHPRARRAQQDLGVGTGTVVERPMSDELTAARRPHVPRLRRPTAWCRSSTSAGSRCPTRWPLTTDDAEPDVPPAPARLPGVRAGPDRRVRPARADLRRRVPLPLVGEHVVGGARRRATRATWSTSSALAAGDLVMEVASNDGYLLTQMQDARHAGRSASSRPRKVAEIARGARRADGQRVLRPRASPSRSRRPRPPAPDRGEQRDGPRPGPPGLRAPA